jgi:hypothetical protein
VAAAAAGAVKGLSREGERASELASGFVCFSFLARHRLEERASERSLAAATRRAFIFCSSQRLFSGKSSSKKWCLLWSFSRVGKRIQSWGSLWKKRRRRRKRSRWRF